MVKEADSFVSANRGALEKYFDKPSPTGILVMTVGSWAKTTKLAKKLSKAGKLIDVTPPKRRTNCPRTWPNTPTTITARSSTEWPPSC